MTLFGEKLKALIDGNGINVSRLAQQAGLERTTIHKTMSGDRMPDIEFTRKLIAALPVSPFEKDTLLAAYNISKDGEFLYKQREQVQLLIERMSAVQDIQADGADRDSIAMRDFADKGGAAGAGGGDAVEVATVSGALSVNSLIDDMLERAICLDNAAIRFVLPHDYTFFYDHLLLKQRKNPKLQIECLFEFYKNTDILKEKRNVNLDVINALVPLIMCGGNFAAHYVYSMNPAGSSVALPMPYFIVTSSEVLLLTADYKKAVILRNPETTACFRNIFDEMKAKGRPLTLQIATMTETTDFYSANIDKCAGVMGFGSHPCIAVYYDYDILSSHLPPDIPNREDTVNTWNSVCDSMRELIGKRSSLSYFTMSGLDLFVEKGVIQTIVEKYFSPYSVDERAETIRNMIRDTENDVIGYRLIDTSKLKIPNCFYADVFGGSHINIVISGNDDYTNTIIIYEDSIVEAFYDFLTNAATTEIAYSKEDTLKVLRHALERVKRLSPMLG